MPKCLVLKLKNMVGEWPMQKVKIMGWERPTRENEHTTSQGHELRKERYMTWEWCVRKEKYRVRE